MHTLDRVSCLFLALLLLVPNAIAQRTTASISGVVTDPSGAVLPGARVTATGSSTGSIYEAQSNSEGFYLITNLQPGTYAVRVEARGFRNYEWKQITLQVGQTSTLNVSLQMGAQADEITVTGAPPLVDTRSQTVSYAITPEFTEQIPLNGRNVLQLLAVAPDTSGHTGNNYSSQLATRPETAESGFFTASGEARENSTAYYLDGGLNEDTYTNVANVFPNPDAVQEFTAETNSYNAKFGGRGGGIVNAITKSGSNRLHGSAYEYLRNGYVNASNYFSTTPDSLNRNQFGFSLGGPLIKDKTFWFGAFQRTTFRYGTSANTAFGPTEAQLNGDWRGDGMPQLVNPFTNDPFPDNQISPSLYNPISLKLLTLVPKADPNTGMINYFSRQLQNDNQFVARVDHNLGSRTTISGSYLWDRLNNPNVADSTNILSGGPNQHFLSQHGALNLTHRFGNNLLTTVGATMSRALIRYTGTDQFPGLAELGANYPMWDPTGIHEVGFYIGGWFTAYWLGAYNVTRTQEDITNNWTYVRGRHTFEFGGELAFHQSLLYQAYVSNGYEGWWCAHSGYDPVDFMLGANCFFEQFAPSRVSPRGHAPALYANDTWRIASRVTLNLGLRWEPFVPWPDSSAGRIGGQINLAALQAGIHSTRYPNLPAGFLVRGDPGVPAGLAPSDYKLFDPRIGIAWDVFGNGKTSLRAGFGIYHDQPFGRMYNQMMSTLPFTQGTVIVDSSVSAYDPYAAPPFNGNPPPAISPPPSDTVFPLPLGNSVGFSPDYKPPATLQWNLTLERQLGQGVMVRAGYEASESYHMFDSRDINAATNSVRPFVDAGYGGTLILDESAGTSSYNALVFSAEKRMSRGLSFLGGFRWAKCLDVGGSNATFAFNEFTDAKHPWLDRGICNSDVSTQFKMAAVWQMPTFPALGFVGKNILGGWTISGILSQHSGYPFTVLASGDTNLDGTIYDRADLAGNPHLSGGRSRAQQLQKWFNTEAFADPAAGNNGTSSRNFLRGPGFMNLDLALIKSVKIPYGPLAETQRIDLRFEAFNLPNHPNFNNPDSAIGDGPTFGKILSAGSPRILQLALKYIF